MSSKKNKTRVSRPKAKICLKSNSVHENLPLHKSNYHGRSCNNPMAFWPRTRSSAEDEQLSGLGSQLKPSPELLAYYKEKIKQYKINNEDLQEKVDQCKSLCDTSFQLEQELRTRNAEVSSLQQAVSDLQVYLYQEREQVLRLYAENDKLKIREVEDRKKIDLLLTLSGTTETELTYFMCDSRNSISVPQKVPPRLKRFRDKLNVGNRGDHPNMKTSTNNIQPASADIDIDLISLQAQSLAAQLEEQTRLYKDQIESLLKDRELCQQEREVERTRLQTKISYLSTKLKEVQDKLCMSMDDFVKLHEKHRSEEVTWLGEKHQITRNLECCREQIGETYPSVLGYAVSGSGTSSRLKQNSNCDVLLLKEELRQRDDLVTLYQDQCVALESEMTNLRAQTVASKNMFKDRTQKMAGQVTYLKNKYDDLDRRRILEAEGFRNDIKLLRNRLHGLEKKISRAMPSSSQVSLASEREQQQLYSTAKDTMNKARQLEQELRNIKSKVLDIEEDLKDSGIFK